MSLFTMSLRPFCCTVVVVAGVCLLGPVGSTPAGSSAKQNPYAVGLVYTEEEREKHGLLGLLPARVLTPQQQLDWCLKSLRRMKDGLDKYAYLREIQDTNEHLFYKLLVDHASEMMPIVYTPTVGLACQNYGLIYRRPRGMFISIKQRGRVAEVLRNWPNQDVKAIVVTDGERILGLGDLGANGMGIPVGKLALYTAFGGVDPQQCLPVVLDVGTNNQEFLSEDSTYLGLRQPRVTGLDYDHFVDEFMEAVVSVFGKRTLVQFEDFANQNAFKFLARYRHKYTMFNDDIQGTAAVTVAGILAAERFSGKNIANSKVLFVGAGEAGVGIANLLVTAMGGDPQEARKKIFLKRSNKLIVKGDEDMFEEHDDRRLFCNEVPEDADIHDLVKIIKWMKPDILIGVSGTPRLFTKEVLETMAEVTDQPIIFPLSNPTHKSECTAEEAYQYTKGKCLFASGSPFPSVTVNGKKRSPQQCNNAFIFPGVGLAVVLAEMTSVPDEVFLIAAKTLAEKCTKKSDFEAGSLFPKLERLGHCSVEIAVSVAKYAFEKKLSLMIAQPSHLRTFIESNLYTPDHWHHH